jgi:hypothetical protein
VDACGGEPARGLGDVWPGDDVHRIWLLPPGCATSTALRAMVVEPNDLLRGRPLPPGAATPFASAIERYYHRNDAPPPAGPLTASQAAGPAATDQLDPLRGPLPSQPQVGQPQMGLPQVGQP